LGSDSSWGLNWIQSSVMELKQIFIDKCLS
jgi:hypothetical protein